jgi:hypothetical protein
MSIKLHLGCGNEIFPGYINIDEFNPKADLKAALQQIAYPENSVERIEGYMVLEHLSLHDARAFLSNAYRMLQPAGTLILEIPDLEKVSRLVLVFATDPDYLEKGAFGLRGFFGEPTPRMTFGDYHKWGYTPAYLTSMVKEAGFDNIVVSDGYSHNLPLRDTRVTAVK